MAKIKEKSWISPLFISTGGTFFGSIGLMAFKKVVEMIENTELDWITVASLCGFAVSGILLVITLWLMYVSISKKIDFKSQEHEALHHAIESQIAALAAERLAHIAILLQLSKHLQHKHDAEFLSITEMSGLFVSKLADELKIQIPEASKLLKECFEEYMKLFQWKKSLSNSLK